MQNTRKKGYYGQFGGMYIPEILHTNFEELIHYFEEAQADPAFCRELKAGLFISMS